MTAVLATAADVEGTGLGRQVGSPVQIACRIEFPDSACGHTVDAVDRTDPLDGGVIVNRSRFRKFGIKPAQPGATVRPVGQSAERKDVA